MRLLLGVWGLHLVAGATAGLGQVSKIEALYGTLGRGSALHGWLMISGLLAVASLAPCWRLMMREERS